MAKEAKAHKQQEAPQQGALTTAFRRAVEGDIPRVMEIFAKSFKGQTAREDIYAYEFLFQATVRDLRYHFMVAVQGGKIEGFSFVNSVDTPGAANLDVIGVNPEAQGAGIGKGLMQEAEKAAARFRLPRLQLQVREDNERAIGFYKRLGYRETGYIPNYYTLDGMDAVVMEKQIPANTQDNRKKPLKSPRPPFKSMK